MSRYIDVDKLIEELDQIEPQAHLPDIYIEGYEDALAAVSEIIENQTTADVQEVKHGKSIKHKSKLDECSECGCTFVVVSDMDNCYCTHCGAKMYKE